MTELETLKQDLALRIAGIQRVGIMCSGGFDSTVLLATLLSLQKEQSLPFRTVLITVPRSDGAADHSARIRVWASQRWSVDLAHHIVGRVDVAHNLQVLSGCHAAAGQNLADFYLLADTAIPEELSESAPERLPSTSLRWYQPWFSHTKDHVVRIMTQLELPEIADITHTCTESTTDRCGQCWQCRERAWAFQQAGVADTGTQ